MIQDFRFAFRQLTKAPGFTAIAVLTLALAIGVNAAIFSIVNGAVLRPVIPLRPAEVVNLFTARQNASRDYRQFSHAEYRDLRENSRELFADVAALEFAVAGIGRPEDTRRSFAFLTSENFFSLAGAQPALGRFYNAEECRPNANQTVVVVSYPFWKKNGGRTDFVGSDLLINGRPFTVIGVTPKDFSGVSALVAPDIWLPLGVHSLIDSAFADYEGQHDLNAPKNYTFNLLARLRSGLTSDLAKTRLPLLAQRLTAMQPPDAEGTRELQIHTPSRFSISTTPDDDGPITFVGTLLLAMAGAVLLIASLNLANMLLARGTARAKEIALRLALGASRWRIVRQLLSEGLLLALAGGLGGLALSIWCNDLLLRSFAGLLGSLNFSFVLNLHPDATVLAVTFFLCLCATLLFSLGPALKATRADLVNDLKQQVGEPACTGRLGRFFAPRHILVMAQIALSLMLLFSAGLFLRGSLEASHLEPGFVPAGDLVTEMDFSLSNAEPVEARRRMFAAVERARQLPGVRAVALGTMLPYGNFTNSRRVTSGHESPVDPKAGDSGVGALFTATTPGYFDAIGVRLLRGRDFTQQEADTKDGPRVAIIDEEMAQKLFPGTDPIGQHLRFTQAPRDGSPNDLVVVGLVNTHRHDVQSDSLIRRLFVPLAQGYNGNVFLHVRLETKERRAVLAFIPTLRQALRQLDPNLPILGLAPFTDLMEKSIGLWIVRLGAILFGVFGGIALLLAVVGVYGVKAYAVARRTREIGIRMALGAHRGDVFKLIMKQGALQTAFALGIGLLLSLGVGRILATMLYKVSPADPLALIVSATLLAAAALLACFFPARRATKVSPMTALRTE